MDVRLNVAKCAEKFKVPNRGKNPNNPFCLVFLAFSSLIFVKFIARNEYMRSLKMSVFTVLCLSYPNPCPRRKFRAPWYE